MRRRAPSVHGEGVTGVQVQGIKGYRQKGREVVAKIRR